MRDAKATSESTPLLLPHETPSSLDGLGHTWPTQLSPTWLGRFLFSWLDPLMALGARRPLQHDDLFQLDPGNRAATVGPALLHNWSLECQKPTQRPRLAVALAKTFWQPVARAALLKLAVDSLQFVLPLMIQRVLTFLQDPAAPRVQGLADAVVVASVGVAQSLLLRNYSFQCFQTGLRVRSAIGVAVYRKSLRLSSAARRRCTTAKITILLAADAARVQGLATHINSLWFSVFQIVVACVLLWQQLGIAMLAGVAVIVAMVPTTAWLSGRLQRVQQKLMRAKDTRLKACYEVLAGIKVVKLQAWENVFTDRVLGTRDEELQRLDALVRARGATTAMFAAIPMLVASAAFLAFVLRGRALDVGTALTSLALFNILRFPLLGFPQLLQSLLAAGVSVERLQEFLCEHERVAVGTGDLAQVGIRIQDATFAWEGDGETKEALRSVEMVAESRQLWAIVGPVGAGKSTLLSGILGDATCCNGSVAVRGTIAHVAQQPFIQHASIRDNITFGLVFDPVRYAEAVRVSALVHDLATFPAGDETEIGEQGVTLSGGQRTRVALARAVYQDADIYVLDDVLAAVDSHVAREIFTECIRGTLQQKLVLVVTHNMSLVPHCDRVLVLEHGRVVKSSNFEDAVATDGGVLQGLVLQERQQEALTSESAKTVERLEETTPAADRRLVVDEDRVTGDVKRAVYAWWLDAMGGSLAAAGVVCVFCSVQAIDVLATLWLSYWSNHSTAATHAQLPFLAVFVGLNTLFACGLYVRSVTVFWRGLRASRKLFRVVLTRLLHAPMAFFDATPLGRITNRLSKDVTAVDETLPSTAIQFASTVVSVSATLVTISCVTPVFTVVLVPVLAGFYGAQRYFVQTSRELHRLDAISRSPVLALLSETLNGLPTIHSSHAQRAFTQRFDALLDQNQRAAFLTFAVNGWLGLRLDLAGTLVATGAVLAAVLTTHGASTAYVALAGVSLSYAFSVTHALNFAVRALSQLQMQMVAVERLKHYAEMVVEAIGPAQDTASRWPGRGEIDFRGVSLRYRPGTPCVLHDVSLTIRAREKIGVVGRTGAGKSSLVVALLRLVEPETGAIWIDGVDTRKMGLHELRRAISVIPQDPVLFLGTVRSNVDPLGTATDDAVWAALRRVHMDEKIEEVSSLDAEVDDKGTNWSVGQRQLLCIARALLARSSILVMDEATASIDAETDQRIQLAIRTEFRDSTCVTIAHRIHTVMDADRILVMDGGRVVECDAPAALLRDPNSRFKSFVDHSRE
jgi:ATP-binding cassette, subfamily C (CFTR/MRP), member 1